MTTAIIQGSMSAIAQQSGEPGEQGVTADRVKELAQTTQKLLAAKVAAIRDTDEANTLLLSIHNVNLFAPSPEGCGHDELSVEAPSLR